MVKAVSNQTAQNKTTSEQTNLLGEKIEFFNETAFNCKADDFTPILELLTKRSVECIILTADEMVPLNEAHMGKSGSTDVLSFPLEDVKGLGNSSIGSIVISIDDAKEAAKKLKHKDMEEVKILFLHGLLHLLGFDHETDNGEMQAKEDEIRKQLNLPTTLIQRNAP